MKCLVADSPPKVGHSQVTTSQCKNGPMPQEGGGEEVNVGFS